MKTSKIILSSFIGIIFIFLLSLLIRTESQHMQTFDSKTVTLTPFSHLKVNSGAFVSVKYGLGDSISFLYYPQQEATIPAYKTINDTLVIDTIPGTGRVLLHVTCSNLKSIELKDCHVYLNQISFNNLSIESINSSINFASVQGDSMWINMSLKSQFHCDDYSLNSAYFKISDSEANFFSKGLHSITAELQDSSKLRTINVLQTKIIADKTSQYNSW